MQQKERINREKQQKERDEWLNLLEQKEHARRNKQEELFQLDIQNMMNQRKKQTAVEEKKRQENLLVDLKLKEAEQRMAEKELFRLDQIEQKKVRAAKYLDDVADVQQRKHELDKSDPDERLFYLLQRQSEHIKRRRNFTMEQLVDR